MSLDYYDYFGSQTTEDFSPTTTSSETDVATVLETTVATPVSTISTFLELQEEALIFMPAVSKERQRKTIKEPSGDRGYRERLFRTPLAP